MKMKNILSKALILSICMFALRESSVAQDAHALIRPQAEIVNPIFYSLLDTAILEMWSGTYFVYLFEMKGEGTYRCWLETHSFSNDMFTRLSVEWTRTHNSELSWIEGYFYYNNILCLVRSSYPGSNFMFSNKTDSVTYAMQNIDDDNLGNDKRFLLIYPALQDIGIGYPFKKEVPCSIKRN